MTLRIAITTLGLSLMLAAAEAGADDASSAAVSMTDEHLGPVSFPVSCASAVRADFSRGVALLHDFWYEEAAPQFQRIVAADSSCAMAHWGVAMSHFHQIWDRPDEAGMAAGWREMQAAQAVPAKTARERAYIAALSAFFRPGPADYPSRISAYAAAMGALHREYADDVDAGAFYALALLAAAAPDDTSLTQNRNAMAVLTPLLRQHPDHPGLLHYVTHACDTPSLAKDGLAAARHYGEIAPSGPHSAHMPGHIFSRLGLWQEDIDSQLASIAASENAAARHQNGWMDQFHSFDFLSYAYLQSGQEERAKNVAEKSAAAIAHFETMPSMAPEDYMMGMYPYYRAKLPIFIALETRDWHAALAIEPEKTAPPDTQTQVHWAKAIAAGHLHLAQAAHQALTDYDALIEELKKSSHAYEADSTGARVRRGEMSAWVAFADGDADKASRLMRETANLQDKVGQGEVDIPAREMLGDILLESGRSAEALAEYQQSMQLSPNRFNGAFNAGKAAQAAGDHTEARRFFEATLKVAGDGSRSKRPEIAYARAFLASAK
jgi:tetratricopeptide (TPR) repeat protein